MSAHHGTRAYEARTSTIFCWVMAVLLAATAGLAAVAYVAYMGTLS